MFKFLKTIFGKDQIGSNDLTDARGFVTLDVQPEPIPEEPQKPMQTEVKRIKNCIVYMPNDFGFWAYRKPFAKDVCVVSGDRPLIGEYNLDTSKCKKVSPATIEILEHDDGSVSVGWMRGNVDA